MRVSRLTGRSTLTEQATSFYFKTGMTETAPEFPKTVQLKNWEEFEKMVSEDKPSENLPTLYRGHACKKWRIKTTLERWGKNDHPIDDYDEKVGKACIRSATAIPGAIPFLELGDIPAHPTFKTPKVDLTKTSEADARANAEAVFQSGEVSKAQISRMAFLRQNGFPSPLLDWTLSPYIAAFFAFDPPPVESGSESVAIIQAKFLDGTVFTGAEGRPVSFRCLDQWVVTDKKHFLQQNRYTVCTGYNQYNRPIFINHEDAIRECVKEAPGKALPFLRKYTIPISERPHFLRKLHQMNITRYSLFESTEGLMQLLARELIR